MQTTPELSFGQMGETLASIDIPACPAVVTQVMAEARKDDPDINVLSRIIAADVGMSAFAIKLANSALYRSSGPVNSVAQAVSRLGTRNILCTVVAVALRNHVIPGVPREVLERFWERAGNLAMAASLTARKVRGVAPDTAYTYALFHDAAIPVLMRRFPDYTATLNAALADGHDLALLENERYQCNHAIVGALLARNWGLAPLIGQAIRHHHDPDVYAPGQGFLAGEAMALVALVHVAEYLLAGLNQAPGAEMEALHGAATAYLGLDEDDLQDIVEAIGSAL